MWNANVPPCWGTICYKFRFYVWVSVCLYVTIMCMSSMFSRKSGVRTSQGSRWDSSLDFLLRIFVAKESSWSHVKYINLFSPLDCTYKIISTWSNCELNDWLIPIGVYYNYIDKTEDYIIPIGIKIYITGVKIIPIFFRVYKLTRII